MQAILFLSFLCISLAFFLPASLTLPVVASDESRRIDVSGKHAFVPPGPGDLRGPCAGLNALANHNYIPHSGLITVIQATEAPNTAWGFGGDMAMFAVVLAQMYASDDGLHISIGGAVPASDAPLTLFADRGGLSATHNHFESDSSPTRGDQYTFNGNNYDAHEPYLKSLVAALKNGSNGIINHRIERYDHSVATNPYFFYGPAPMGITTLVHLFITNVMANFDPAYPDGHFSEEGLYSLFGFTPDASGRMQYTPGHERIPENWYRRANDFTFKQAAPQILAFGRAAPHVLVPGGNMGAVNTFTPMDLGELTRGVYTEETLFAGNNSLCFVFQVLPLAMGAALFLAGGAVESALEEWACPKLGGLNEEMYDRYPGYKMKT
ncbi:Chloroperoxidase [Mycena rosella]|uniref:Chloroperoxidase n=1 Tax=Mycena rosella TaxID=1033263 RepID=A0AAD7F5E8_MYCRO|nr:Chloroperoxidase [Mycena rosella]